MSMIKDSDILASYKAANPEGRFEIMYEHFSFFPKVITKKEAKAKYKIGKYALYNVEKIDEYLEYFLEKENGIKKRFKGVRLTYRRKSES